MKKLSLVCLSVLMVLLIFSSCGENGSEDDFFIGQVNEVSNGEVLVSVYSQYSDKYGDMVSVETDAEINDFGRGDEIRVSVETVTGEKVKASKIKKLLYDCDKESIVCLDKITIPNDFPNFLGDVSFTVEDTNCFATMPYRVVKQNTRETYLSSYYETEVETVIFGNITSECTVGDFVYVATKKHKTTGTYTAVEKEDLTKLDIASADNLGNDIAPGGGGVLKPVVYLYPEENTVVNVELDLDFGLTCTYPDYNHGEGWKDLNVMPDGTIIKSGREYYCLYWEGDGFKNADFSKGFCVKGTETAQFLEKVLFEIGLNEREANEFIIYWLPVLQVNDYNIISFQGENYTDSAKLNISPKPDNLLRVFMSYKPCDEYVNIEPQTFEKIERNGFTVVEWGGGPAAYQKQKISVL